MDYPFEYSKCKHKEIISMPITEYVATGHLCEECDTEMVREVKSLVCSLSIDKTGGFYRSTN